MMLWMSAAEAGEDVLYSSAHCPPSSNASSFHARNAIASTTVGWITSAPGKTPHVTAFGPSLLFVRRSPSLLTWSGARFSMGRQQVSERMEAYRMVSRRRGLLDEVQELRGERRRGEELEVSLEGHE